MKYVIFLLMYSGAVFSQTGSMIVNPSVCELGQGEENCSVYISWNVVNASNVCLWRYGSGLSPAKVACLSSASNIEYPWVNVAGKTLELRYGSLSYGQSTLLDTESVHAAEPAAPTGVLSTNSNVCQLQSGGVHCSIYASWSSSNAGNVCLWRKGGSLSPAKVICQSNGSNVEYPWVSVSGKTLELRHGSKTYSQSFLFNTKQVHALSAPSPSGNMTISPQSCQLNPGEIHCSAFVSWSSSNALNVCLWRLGSGLSPAKIKCSLSDSNVEYSWVDINGKTLELRQGSLNYSSSTLLKRKEVIAKPVIAKGGTIFAWYQHSWEDGWDPYDHEIYNRFGLIKNYHFSNVRSITKENLALAYNEGQRRIGLDFFYGRTGRFLNADEEMYINTRAKKDNSNSIYYIDPQYIQNLKNLLADVKAQGFEEVLFNTLPDACNKPKNWANWYKSCKKDIMYTFNGAAIKPANYDSSDSEPVWQQTPLWEENWQVLKELTLVLENSQIDYTIDLGNEDIPIADMKSLGCSQTDEKLLDQCLSSHQEEFDLLQARAEGFLNKIWTKYINYFGKLKTNGFSVISNTLWQAEQRSATMNKIYGTEFPSKLNLHIYADSYQEVENVFNHYVNMVEFAGVPVIIGEAYYNDSRSAEYFSNALLSTGINLDYIIQWPKARKDDGGVEGFMYPLKDSTFENYKNKGF